MKIPSEERPTRSTSKVNSITSPFRLGTRDLEVAFDVNENENTYWLSVISRAQSTQVLRRTSLHSVR